MNEPTGVSGSDELARWEALEVEARDRLENEARAESAGAPTGPPPVAGAWDANGPSWWEDPASADRPGDQAQHAVGVAPDAPAAPRILLADADPAVAAMIDQAMTDRGWVVTVVDNGEVALAEFLRSQPHCFVFDYSLPGLGGLDLLRKLDEYGIVDDTRLVVNSTQTQAIHVQRAKAAGVHRFLDRPRRSADHLVDAVAEQLELLGMSGGTRSPGSADAPPDFAASVPAAPAAHVGSIFAEPDPSAGSDPVPAQPTPAPETARPETSKSYRSAFGSGGGPPGRVPKLD